MPLKINWPEAIKPLLKKYKKTKHPLDYKNRYQLLVSVILSAQDSDKHINQLSPELFKAFPNMEALSRATPETLFPFIGKVRNHDNKSKWLIEIAQKIKKDRNIPLTLDELTELPGIGRKSANVIKREAGADAEGVIVDLHVVRVAPRLGIASGTDPKKIGELLRAIMGYSGNFVTLSALRLSALVFLRPGEIRSAEWADIDLEQAIWRIPAAKMKMKDFYELPMDWSRKYFS